MVSESNWIPHGSLPLEAVSPPAESQPLAGSSDTPPKQSRYPSRQALRTKTNCPGCGVHISYHALLYRHKCPKTACDLDTQVEKGCKQIAGASGPKAIQTAGSNIGLRVCVCAGPMFRLTHSASHTTSQRKRDQNSPIQFHILLLY